MTLFFSKVQAKVSSSIATNADTSHTTGSVISKDGTKIGYRQYGHGTPFIIVQGAIAPLDYRYSTVRRKRMINGSAHQ